MNMEHFRVPIPEESRVTKDRLVQHQLHNIRTRKIEWTTIGKLPPDGDEYDEDNNLLMIPNSLYRIWFSAFYRYDVVDRDPDNYPPFFSHGARIGPFALFLGAVSKSGLYDALIDAFGLVTANALLDIAMYYNRANRMELTRLDANLEDQIVFSIRPHSVEWYEDRVAAITDEQIEAFMERWSALRRNAHRDTAIHYDASTRYIGSDYWSALTVCETGGDYPGLPLAYHLSRDSDPVPTDYRKVKDFFQGLGLQPKRVIGGTSPLTDVFFPLCEAMQLPWLHEMDNGTLAYKTVMERYEEELRQGHGTPITAREPMVAVREEDVLLFGPDTIEPDRRGVVSLYCVPDAALKSHAYMTEKMDKAYSEACRVLDKLQKSKQKRKLPIPDPAEENAKNSGDEDEPQRTAEQRARDVLYGAVCEAGGLFYDPDTYCWNCFELVYHPEEKRYHCVINEDRYRYYRCRGCYFTMASSEPMDLQAISDDYPLSYFLGGDLFEVPFSAMHEQLNCEGPDITEYSNWFFAAFLSDIVRALLLPAFRQFEAEKDGEIRAQELEDYTEEELEEKAEEGDEPVITVAIGKMLQWLDDVQFARFTLDGDLRYDGHTAGVRGAVLKAAGVPLTSLPLFSDLVNIAEDPVEVRRLRRMKRTFPKKRRGPAGSPNKQDSGKD